MAQLHEIKRRHPNKKRKIVGRGGKRGGYSGRGIKGQKARAGGRLRPEMRDIIKKLPKRRGYRTPALREKPSILNIKDIERALGSVAGPAAVNPKTLAALGLVRSQPVSNKVKILGLGEATRPYRITDCAVSKSAREKILKAGGHVAG